MRLFSSFVRLEAPCAPTRRRLGSTVTRRSAVTLARPPRRGQGSDSSSRPAAGVVGVANVRARWTVDCTYGNKMRAIEMLQEWVQEVGAYADPPLNETNTSMSAGNIGAPESRLELEVAFESLDALERFWGSIDPSRHVRWGEKVKGVIIDGSPRWEVWRGVDPWAQPTGGLGVSSAASRAPPLSSTALEVASWDDMDKYAGKNWASTFEDAKELLGSGEGAEGGAADGVAGGDTRREQKEKPVLKDWKGDPMVINPGDRLPFTFD